jgi:GNAT superfamily N-acetyltransferase
MSTGTEVRLAELGDADAIAEVHVASWRGAYTGLLPASVLDAHTVERRAARWREGLANANQRTWVALSDGIVVGFASGGPARDPDVTGRVGELYAIYVTPAAWDRGVGHALHQAALAALGDEYDAVVLWVLDGNARARRFYGRHGWSPDGAVKQEHRGESVLNEVRYRRN